MTQSELFKAAHRLATQIRDDENIRYSRALSRGLKRAYNHRRLMKSVKNDLTEAEKKLIINSKGNLKIKTIINHDIVNLELVEKLEKYTWKSWEYGGGFQMMFTDELIKNLY